MRFTNFDGTLNASTSTIENGTMAGVFIGADGADTDSDGNLTFASTFMIDSVDTTDPTTTAAFEIDGFTGTLSMAGDIDNDTGRSVLIENVSENANATNITFTLDSDITDINAIDSKGILLQENDEGTITFLGDISVRTTNASAVTLLNNGDTDISMNGVLALRTEGSANDSIAFDATGGGMLTILGTTNTITTDGGIGVRITDMDVNAAGVNFATVNVMSATNGIVLMDNTGGPIVLGDPTATMAGDSGTITGVTGSAVVIDNSANVSINALQIDAAAGQSGVFVNKDTTGTQIVDLSDLEINGGDIGVEVTGGVGAGNLTMSVNDTNINNSTARGMSFNDVAAGTIQVNVATVDPTAAATEAVFLDNNDGVTFTFAGLDVTTAAASNSRGLVAQNGGTISASGTTNVIDTDNGSGLVLTDMTIGSASFQSVTVDGAAGPANAIVLQNLTGGQIAIGPASGAVGDGGMLRSTADAIVLTNVQNVDLRQIQILNALGDGMEIMHTAAATTTMDVTIDGLNVDAATGSAITASAADNSAFNLRLTDSVLANDLTIGVSGSGAFGLLLDANAITTMAAADDAFSLDFNSSQTADVTIRNNNTFTAANANAFEFTASGTNVDVDFRMDDNTFSNNSGASETANFLVNGGATVDATVVNNTFSNSGADEFAMTSDGSSTRIDLNLDNNTAGVYELTTANQGVPTVDFNFGVVDRDNADANNAGNVNFNPAINQFEDIMDTDVDQPSVP